MEHPWLPPLLLLLVLAVSSLWVLSDAQSRERARRPVVVEVLGVTVERPPVWAALCLVLFVFAFPLYLVARRADA